MRGRSCSPSSTELPRSRETAPGRSRVPAIGISMQVLLLVLFAAALAVLAFAAASVVLV